MQLRPTTIDDALSLYRWRRDPITRAMSFGPPPETYEDHCAWLMRRLQRPWLFIAHLDDIPIGTIGLDRDNGRFLVGLTVAPVHRSRGHGVEMIRALLDVATEESLTPIEAHIKPDNAPSLAAFQRCGFRHCGGDDDRLRFVWHL